MQTGTETPTGIPEALGITEGSLNAFYNEVLAFPGAPAAIFLLFVALGAIFSKYVVRLLGRPIARRFVRQSVAQTMLRATRLGIILLFAFTGLGAAGIELGNIVLSVGVFSAVVGIILAPIVGSIINGVFVLADQPYEIGDMIELTDGTTGFVDDITLRFTKILTMDNTFAVIPNSVIRDDMVKNYSAEDERTRLSIDVAVSYESDVAKARSLIERAASDCEDVVEGGPDIRIGTARYPAKPTCYIDQFGDHGVYLRLRYWAHRPYKLLTVRSKVQTEVWRLLNEEDVDVTIPYPHQHLVFDDTSGTAEVNVGEGRGVDAPSSPARRD
ncbi:mechanosensitive ion channel family protein [Halorarum halophilum]|uniref:Mechanosensitive ion channel family protein n=1 Tax=Halorarum halophilum TaxID=2743090 RepID=A0A7D5KCD7_9EURY|nr:mechanosensitive ion channel family protein [Halobaculum halophilum]QLG26537.1 mechanosensitive ion channel family protein [Halobaculum halophilum]